MIDRAAGLLAQIAIAIAIGALLLYALRELWLTWRARRLTTRMELLRDLLDGAGEDTRAFALIRRRPGVWRDLEALEHLLEERRAKLVAEPSPEATRQLYESYDTLGIVDRYIRKLQHGRTWGERAFAARYLGEIGNAKAVGPLIAVMRNTREEDRDVRMAASRALGRIRDPRALDSLVEALGAPESWVPARVAEVIVQFGDAAIDCLMAVLARPGDPSARAWAAQILGDLGNARVVPVLIGCLTDLHDQVRARAASALGRLGERRAVPELIRVMLADPVPYVRIQVVRALGALGDPRALHHLIDALKDGEWWVRVRVVEALEQLGEQAVEPLTLALEDRDAEVRARAAMTLERLGVLDRLVEQLKDVDSSARDKLLTAGQAGVVEILIEALEHEDERIRFIVTEILGEVRNPAVSVALIGKLEKEHDPRLRAVVVRSLASLEEASAAAPIARLLGDADERIRIEAVRALERIQMPDPHVLLDSAVRDPQPRVRAGAALVLGKVGDARAVPQLLGLLSDADPHVRVESARALGFLRAEEAVPSLMESFRDIDPAVQVAAARALGQIGSPKCLDVLVRGLENAPPELGAAIAWAVGQIQWDDAEKLIDVLFQGNDRSSRLGVLAALAQLGHSAGRELIRSMMHDSDPEVIRDAVARLGQLRDVDSLPDLHALLASPDEATRLAVLDALCRIGDRTSLVPLRQSVFDPSDRVRAQAVLALGYLDDADSGDLLRGVLASPRSTPDMRGYAILSLMVLGREGDLPAVLDALAEFPLHDFLQSRARLEDPILRATIERVRGSDRIEYLVASIQSRTELEATLVRDLGSAHETSRRVRVIRTLAYLRSKGAYTAVWRTFHKDPAEEVRIVALQYLSQAAPPEDFFRLLVDGLNDLQPRVRAEALRRLQDVPIEQALPLVLGQLGGAEPELQAVLLEYLSGLPEDVLDRILDGVLGAELGPEARELLVRVLGRARHRQSTGLLEAFLEEEDPRVRRAAVGSIAQMPGERTTQLVASSLQDPDLQVRCAAVDAAAGMGATRGVPLLRLALADPAPDVRRRAVLRLARVAPRTSIDEWSTAARDADPRVRAAALAALLVEGSQPVEDWVGPHDVPGIATALRELGRAEELERKLASARPVQVRVGALKALFFAGYRLRAQALAAARVDPAPAVQATGRRLEEILAGWLAEPEAAAHLVDAPAPESSAPESPADSVDAAADSSAVAGSEP